MAERNCKKCFHHKACKEVASHSGYGDIDYTESQCKHFTPTADVAEVKHGKWIYKVDDLFPAESTQECSICHEEESCTLCNENYCPNCGAIMDEGSNQSG